MMETHGWHFASFYLDLGAERLWHGADAVHLTAKAFGVLRHLVAHAGQLVTKDELVAAVWATPYVSEAALAVCIRELRQALGDTALTPQYVETVRGRGYRFVTPVTSAAPVLDTGGGTARQAIDRPGLVVEREAELGVLQRCWAQAQQGVLQIIMVTGDAGIGKTTLVDAFVAQVEARATLWVAHGQ